MAVWPFAVIIPDVATPNAFVTAVFTPFANDTDPPTEGAVNVTVTPLAGVLLEFITVATSGNPKGVLRHVVCDWPPVAAIE